MNDYALLAVAFVCIISIFDKSDHNRKLNKFFPDSLDPEQSKIRRELECSMYLEVIFLIGSVIALLLSLIGGSAK